MTPNRFPRRMAAAAAAVLLLATACVPGGAEPSAEPAPGTAAGGGMPAAPAGLEDFYDQDVAWSTCEESFECAEVDVPLDYSRPDAETISLALIRKRAPMDPKGSLLVNPGGPGASGVDMVRDGASTMFSAELRSGYDIVGFDPRGVSRSAPVLCAPEEEYDAAMDASRQEQWDTSTDAGLAEMEQVSKEYARDCAENTGVSLAFVDTTSAARDLDVLRAVLGDERLNYLGYSYGSKLGAAYAGLFPANVGRMVLDGAMDPSLDNEEVTLGQARAFEEEIRAYLEDCLATDGCPFNGDVDDALGQLHQLLADVEDSPLTASDGRLVPIGDFVSGFIVPFYEDALWPMLTSALEAAQNGDPDEILYLADLGAGRSEDGTYAGNMPDAFAAINCLDYPMETDLAAQKEDAAELAEASPTLGEYLAFGGTGCKDWQYPATGSPTPASAPGAAPIVVVGTTGDPATPYEWSEALSAQLESSVLVTYEGHGHTAYGRSNECIGDAVDEYLLGGTVPKDGLVC